MLMLNIIYISKRIKNTHFLFTKRLHKQINFLWHYKKTLKLTESQSVLSGANY